MRIAIVGGTFDPIHLGHVKPVLDLISLFKWDEIHLLPTFTPPYRNQPLANDKHRWEMVKLAASIHPKLVANEYELASKRPSRTLPTLQHFHKTYPQADLYFVTGMDSLIKFDQWENWQQLTKYAHFVVLERPGYSISQASEVLRKWLDTQVKDSLFFFPSTAHVDVSSTEIRTDLNQSSKNIVPEHQIPEVFEYIQAFNLYR